MATEPSSDILTTGWVLSAGAQAFALVDESVASDSDYVTSPLLDGGQGPIVFGIGSLEAGEHTVWVRARYTSGSGKIRASLLNGVGVVQGESAWQDLTDTFSAYALSVVTSGSASRLMLEVDTSLPPGYLGLDGSTLSLDGQVIGLT